MTRPNAYYRSQYGGLLILEELCRCKWVYFVGGQEYRREVGTYISRGMRYDPQTFITNPTSIEVDKVVFVRITQEEFEGCCFERVLVDAT